MIVEQQVIGGTGPRQAFGHLYCPLVVAVHKVYLPSLDAHSGISAAGFFEMLVEHVEHRPEHDIHPFLASIVDEPLQVDVGNGVHDIAFRGVVPSLIEHHIGNMVLGGKVDVILIGTGIDACLEVYSFQVPVVPPVPCHLSGSYPVGASYLVGGGEPIDHVVHRHLRVVVSNGHHSPGVGPRAFRLGDEILGFLYITHAPPFVVGHGLRIFGE